MMERTRQRSLAVVPQESSPQTQAQLPKLRKRLQKSATKQRNFTGSISLIRGRLSSDNSDQATASSDKKFDTANSRRTTIAVHSHAQAQRQKQRQQPCLLPNISPDLNDSKWSHYLLRETGCFCPKTREPSLLLPPRPEESEPLLQEKPTQIIPELSHLAISNAKQQNLDNKNSSSDSSSSPITTMNNPALRRRAKTPIFSIGQLENIPRPGKAFASDEKRLSAEVMAEQYRALIASRNSILKETRSEPSQSRLGHQDEDGYPYADDDCDETDHQPRGMDLLQPEVHLPNGSPTTSDDGTLVGFEEETVYFKPVSFSPEPETPELFEHQQQRFQSPLPHQMPGNLSLQICLDLLTRDLSSGLRGAGLGVSTGNGGNNSNTSALQVWVMIEAYERLKDQLFVEASNGRLGNLNLSMEEVGELGVMMDLWLRALYCIHDGLVGVHGERERKHDE